MEIKSIHKCDSAFKNCQDKTNILWPTNYGTKIKENDFQKKFKYSGQNDIVLTEMRLTYHFPEILKNILQWIDKNLY